jgi:2-polyprenyl-6-methoxyphenol hydroxylase-like FAD-dependent oxidoreductase
MFDAIIIGSRCAGAPTAMLLARRGRRVLLVDRATFPSDVLSGHVIHPAGMARLARWGLLDRVRATGVPISSNVRFDDGHVVLEGSPVPIDGIDVAACIRRTVIDPLLTDAAAEAGAEVRLGFSVTGLLHEGGRVVGVSGHDGQGHPVEERAAIVIGADGVNSFVARTVGAPAHVRHPATTVTAYSYWRDLDVAGLELYARPRRAFIVAPTNDGLTLVALQVPVGEADRFRGRVADAFAETVAEVPRLARLVHDGTRAERFRFGRIHDSFRREPAGPGWALVGDAGVHKDPITAQGMLDAFRDAEHLAEAVDTGLSGDLDAELVAFGHRRDAAVRPMFELTRALADLEAPPPAGGPELFAALRDRPEHIARFLGVLAGSVPIADFFHPHNIQTITAAPAA